MKKVVDSDTVKRIAERNNLDISLVETILNTDYTESELRDMNLITQLRLVGRVKGVKSPTNKSVDQLIDSILDIQAGRVSPVFTFKGRKAKNKVSLLDQRPIEKDTFVSMDYYDGPLGVGSYSSDPNKRYRIPIDNARPDHIPDTPDDVDATDATDEYPCEDDFKVEGVLDVFNNNYGFLRVSNYDSSKYDVFVSPQLIKRFNLRAGDKLQCTARKFERNKAPAVIFIHTINEQPCEKVGKRPYFADFLADYPSERILLSLGAEENDYSLRVIDVVAPIGKGQRGLIVASPKTGKTTLIKKIARSVIKTYGDSIKVMILLVAERPEEVTDIQNTIPQAEVVFSTFDHTPVHQATIAERALSNAKRRVEQGQDVLVLLDSITRLVHAHNRTTEFSAKSTNTELSVSALKTPKAFFGSARKVEKGGSLTILATALVETGSRVDDFIYEEFKGTGNMEIYLDNEFADRRIFPAVNLRKSGTRHEEKLLTQKELEGMWLMRRKLADTQNKDVCEQLFDMFTSTANNDEFFDTLKTIK